MVLELREFLNEHVYTCFFTHYYFEHMGKRLNDYTELAELNLLEDPHIYMRPGTLELLKLFYSLSLTLLCIEKYDERNARHHIKRVKEILSTPPVLTAQ